MNHTHGNSPDSVLAFLNGVEQMLAAGDKAELVLALEQLLMIEREISSNRSGETDSLLIAVLTGRGHVERAVGRNRSAIETYHRALTILDECEIAPEFKTERSANLWTYRGLAALSEEDRVAVEYFERAIQLRESAPLSETRKASVWGLSAAWINRGDALQLSGGNQSEAIRSFEIALELLNEYDVSVAPSVATRVALAWMKKGAALASIAEAEERDRSNESLESYSKAVHVLRPGAEAGIEESVRMLGVALSNISRARIQLYGVHSEAGELEAREGLGMIRQDESTDVELVELGLNLRGVLCKTIELGAEIEGAHDEEISDLADEGLGIAKSYFSSNTIPPGLFPLIGQLFRMGAEAYFRSQPQFLAEYLLEHLDPEKDPAALSAIPQCHEAAVEIIWRGIGTFQQNGFTDLGTEKFSRSLEQQSEWQRCRERLAEIREQYLEIPA